MNKDEPQEVRSGNADGIVIRPTTDADAAGITAVFNYHVDNSFAAYPDQRVDEPFFHALRGVAHGGVFYSLATGEGKVVGFGLLKKHHVHATFKRTAEVMYFILPEYCEKGLGSRLLDTLTRDAANLGIDTLLANISSHNRASIAFHAKHGFSECGRFRNVGRKFGKDFDVVWMQKFI